MQIIKFFVPGIPAPGGSKRGFKHPHTGRIIITDDCRRNKDWRASVAATAHNARTGPLLQGSVFARVSFKMPRPKSHFKKDGTLKPNAPKFHTVKPDATKLWRSTEDALKGIVVQDDSQIAQQFIEKVYADEAGAEIQLFELENISDHARVADSAREPEPALFA